jgi:hypothetical protein
MTRNSSIFDVITLACDFVLKPQGFGGGDELYSAGVSV